MRRTPLAMIFCSALLLASPAMAFGAEGTTPARLPDAALPAPLDRVLRDYEQAWRNGDAKALAALFAEDGFVLQSNQPPVRGRSAIEAAYAGQGSSPLRLRALAYSMEGNTGYIIGAYRYGNNVVDTGKFTLTLKRVGDGPWLIFSDMDNTSAPPRAR
ncbi:YybH family protein [Stenotrophomonas maltophilia]|uniref:YybH family protein n=1 Tax=Stenotrophomonas maltophilia TaxID=40324 RepID=UPI001E4B00D9|nr:nuclear transport factor 2 family protein [Stenotrophomonas maltophilia]